MNNFCRNLSILLAFAIILGTSSLTVFGENSSAAKQDAAESVCEFCGRLINGIYAGQQCSIFRGL